MAQGKCKDEKMVVDCLQDRQYAVEMEDYSVLALCSWNVKCRYKIKTNQSALLHRSQQSTLLSFWLFADLHDGIVLSAISSAHELSFEPASF